MTREGTLLMHTLFPFSRVNAVANNTIIVAFQEVELIMIIASLLCL